MKKTIFSVLVTVLLLALALPTATMVQAAPDTALLTPAWSMTTNTMLSPTTDGLGDALKPWDGMTPWGAWTPALWNGANPSPVSGRTIPGFESGYTWMYWTHGTPDWNSHSDQWLHAQVVIPACWVVTSVQLVYVRNSTPTVLYDIPINDNLYVYVDETYVAGGGTATATSPPSSVTVGDYLPTGALPPPHPDSDDSEGWPDPLFKAAEGFGGAYLPETDWEIPGGLGLPPEFFSPGTHDIHVIVEEFRTDGGVGHLGFEVTYEEASFVSLTPELAYNPAGTDHTVTATITPAVAGVPITFVVTGANSASGVVNTEADGTAQFTYTGTNSGVDTITAYIDCNGDTTWTEGEPTISATKEWLANFVTGGGNIKEETTNPKGKTIEKVAWTFGGNVGYLIDGTLHGQFQINDHMGKESWHCHNLFDSLIFWGGPTLSPPASLDTAQFVGTFTSNKGNTKYLRVTIWDDQEPGKDFDWITVEVSTDSGANWNPWFDGEPISGGNLQVHEGFKG